MFGRSGHSIFVYIYIHIIYSSNTFKCLTNFIAMPDPEKRYQRDRGSTSPAARCVELGRVTKLNLDQGLDVRFRRISMFLEGHLI